MTSRKFFHTPQSKASCSLKTSFGTLKSVWLAFTLNGSMKSEKSVTAHVCSRKIRLKPCIDATIFFFVSSNGQSFFVASNFFWLPKQTFRNERNERNGTRRGPLWGAEWSGASEVSGENVCFGNQKNIASNEKKTLTLRDQKQKNDGRIERCHNLSR